MGREFVRQIGYFYRSLDEIWVFARRKERLERLRSECRVPLRIFDGDLLKKTGVPAVSQRTEREKA